MKYKFHVKLYYIAKVFAVTVFAEDHGQALAMARSQSGRDHTEENGAPEVWQV